MKAASKLIALTSLGLATLLGGGCDIEWNFTKFLIDRDGNVVNRFHPTTTPETIDAEIATLLNGQS